MTVAGETLDTTSGHEVYVGLAPFYDALYGIGLQPGRMRALQRLAVAPGESVLEIGVGTGLSAMNYPAGCRVVAIDLSGPMLQRARTRLSARNLRHVALCQMNGAQLAFQNGQFDAVYAPYFINTVPEPARVGREMVRVCRAGGRIVFLNHFHQPARAGLIDALVGLAATKVSGVNWRVDLQSFLRDTGLEADSVEHVNFPRVSSVVVCRRR